MRPYILGDTPKDLACRLALSGEAEAGNGYDDTLNFVSTAADGLHG